MLNTVPIPEPIIICKNDSIPIGDIISNYDPNKYDKATTKYRKPSYQRALKKSSEWCISLIESILDGLSIGSITMSKWNVVKKDGDNIYSEIL